MALGATGGGLALCRSGVCVALGATGGGVAFCLTEGGVAFCLAGVGVARLAGLGGRSGVCLSVSVVCFSASAVLNVCSLDVCLSVAPRGDSWALLATTHHPSSSLSLLETVVVRGDKGFLATGGVAACLGAWLLLDCGLGGNTGGDVSSVGVVSAADLAPARFRSVLSGKGGGAESAEGVAVGVVLSAESLLSLIFLMMRGDGLGEVGGALGEVGGGLVFTALGRSHVDSLVCGL